MIAVMSPDAVRVGEQLIVEPSTVADVVPGTPETLATRVHELGDMLVATATVKGDTTMPSNKIIFFKIRFCHDAEIINSHIFNFFFVF